MRDISLQELLEAGCHFGHQVRRWNPSMKQYIYGERDGIHILDLAKTKAGLEEAGEYVKKVVAGGGVVLFVGTKRQATDVVKAEAMRVGMPYMTSRWIGGLLTNFEQLSKRIRKMKDMMAKRAGGEYKRYTKREQLLIDREIAQLQKFFSGVADMEKLPDALVVVDAHKEDVAVREGKKTGVPVVAMTDTNARREMVDVAIPVNDDAAKSIELVVKYLAEAVEEGKKGGDKPAESEKKSGEKIEVEQKNDGEVVGETRAKKAGKVKKGKEGGSYAS